MEGNMTDLDTEYKLLQLEIKKLSIQMENTSVMAKGYKELLRKEINLTLELQKIINRMIEE
jgi:hypothetical protein